MMLCVIIAEACFLALEVRYVAVLQGDYDGLRDIHNELETNHLSLTERHTYLEATYENLTQNHSSLVSAHEELKRSYGSLESELAALKQSYQSLKKQLPEIETTAYNSGYMEGIEDAAGRGFNIRDPAYDEAIDFIRFDRTDANEWSENYTCLNFAAEFKNNAFEHGYRCGFVEIEFREGGHAIVCFNTLDKGLIFVEPQHDDIITLKIGEPLFDRTEYVIDFDDTVIRFIIVW